MDEIQNSARKAKNEYYKAWRAKNKDKVRESQLRYWSKRANEKAEKEVTDNGADENN